MSDTINQKTYALFNNSANRKLISELEKTNADIVLFPPVRPEKNALNEEAIVQLNDFKAFDWLIFADVLAVDYFLELLEENSIELFELDFLRICAIGESIADRLRFSSIHSDVIPITNDVKDILSALNNYIGQGSFADLRFLFPKQIDLEERSSAKLITAGAFVYEMPIYTVENLTKLESARFKNLINIGAIDEFILTDPTDFIALKHYCGNKKLSEVLSGLNVSAVNDLMRQAAEENNLPLTGLFRLANIAKVKK